MTELEARRMLNEHLTRYPKFIVARHLYTVHPSGRVEIWSAVGKSGQRWKFDHIVAGDSCWLPDRVRARAAEEARS